MTGSPEVPRKVCLIYKTALLCPSPSFSPFFGCLGTCADQKPERHNWVLREHGEQGTTNGMSAIILPWPTGQMGGRQGGVGRGEVCGLKRLTSNP